MKQSDTYVVSDVYSGTQRDPIASRRDFLRTMGAACLVAPRPVAGVDTETTGASKFDRVAQARRNSVVRSSLSPDFFEGMLLGNGDLGVVVVVRPDALGLHIGKADSWDVRVSEDHDPHVLPFDRLLELWNAASDAAKREGDPNRLFLEKAYPPLADYLRKTRSSYAKPWPRPWPCGTVWFHWDPRWVSLMSQKLDISDGLMTAAFEVREPGRRPEVVTLSCFVSWDTGHLAVFSDAPAPITSVAYYPNVEAQLGMPLPELNVQPGREGVQFTCFQRLPLTAPTGEIPNSPLSSNDSSFALAAILQGGWQQVSGETERGVETGDPQRVVLESRKRGPLRFDLAIFTPLDDRDNAGRARAVARSMAFTPISQLRRKSQGAWHQYWLQSAVKFEDCELERIWYFNQYLLACCLKAGKVAPGLFGNWNAGKIGTAWHGDYHMNYNTQQVFWSVFSSNHVDQHLPYVDLVEKLMPIGEREARENFKLPGAYFPHSAYPVPTRVNPYPVPPWAYQVCETPWTVQSLWWHYLYTLDVDYLRRVYPLLRAATTFMVHYVRKGQDGKYHIEPTVSPENWGFTVDFRLNRDCIIDLALTEFLLDATVQSSVILGVDEAEREEWMHVSANLASYPKASGPYGEVWLDVVDAPVEHVYSHPVTLAPVFPAEQVGLGRNEEMLEIARRTAATVRLEGATDLVVQPLVRARLGMLDLAWFKKEVAYCLLPNGAAGDRVRQVRGRYRDSTSFDFLMRMGIWVENLSLPVVLNECLLQSYTGTLRVFPNTQGLGPARFQDLRAVGAFLVSGAWDGHQVTSLKIRSEKGTSVRLVNPWKDASVGVRNARDGSLVRPVKSEGDIVSFDTSPGMVYSLARSDRSQGNL